MTPTSPASASTLSADVLVVGAGPTGLALAAALRVQGLQVIVVDRQAEGANTSRAAVVHARTLEVLEPLGMVERLVRRGIQAARFTIRDHDRVLMDIGFSRLPTRYPYTLMVSQAVTEQVLLQRLQELGGQVLRPRTLVALEDRHDRVVARLDDGTVCEAKYVAGADGMHSAVRQLAGIDFDGATYGDDFVLADVQLQGAAPSDEVILYFSPEGMVVVAPLPGGFHRVVATVDQAPPQPDIAFVQQLLDTRASKASRAVVGEMAWSSRFRVHHRIARHYRSGRIVLAGDAAHVHSPAGGQGMNAGILDAMRLAAALGDALAGDEQALDRYGAERRPVAQKIIELADRLTRMATVPPRLRPLRNLAMGWLSRIPALRRRLAWQLSGLAYR